MLPRTAYTNGNLTSYSWADFTDEWTVYFGETSWKEESAR